MPDIQNEGSLVERAKLDPEAFGELYDLYYDRIIAYIFRRTMDVWIAEDLTSSTFLKALKALRKYDHKAPFKAWLYRIATNEIRMHWRWASKHSRLEDSRRWEMAYGKVEVSGSPIVEREEFEERLRRCDEVRRLLESLPERYRVPLALRFFEELSCKEIATVLNRPTGTVRVYIHRGLKRLKRILCESTVTF